MKSNGSRWSTVPQFVRQCIHLYNYQIQQMIKDYRRFHMCTLTSIGYSIMWSHTVEYQKILVPSFKLIALEMKHDMTQQCTFLRGTFAMDKKGADTHGAGLSWQHHNHDEASLPAILYPFTFRCEIHEQLCDSMNCPCVCINYLLEHFQTTDFEETFQHLPSHV